MVVENHNPTLSKYYTDMLIIISILVLIIYIELNTFYIICYFSGRILNLHNVLIQFEKIKCVLCRKYFMR